MTPLLWSVLLILGGMLIIAAELFIPSGGVLSIFAALTLVAAIIVAFADSMATGAMALSAVVILVPLVAVLLLRWWPRTAMGRRILLQSGESQYQTEENPLLDLLGQSGIVRNEMRPNGRVQIGGRIYDAVSQGTLIEEGTHVVVAEVDGIHIQVRPLREGEIAESPADVEEPSDETPFEDPFAS